MSYKNTYLIEDAIKDLVKHFKTSFNNEVTKMNEARDDGFEIEEMNEGDWYFASVDQSTRNNNSYFVLYTLDNEPALQDQTTENFLEKLTMTFYVCTYDNGQIENTEILTKLLRYREILKELSKSSHDFFRGYAKPTVVSLKPDVWEFENSDVMINVGLSVSATFSN